MQGELFPLFQARPKLYSDETLVRACELFRPFLAEDLEGATDAYIDNAIIDVKKAVEYDGDAFSICKSLECAGWHVDQVLVETMARFEHCRYRAHREVVREWAQSSSVKPTYAIGDHVTINHRGKIHKGIVVAVKSETLEYSVRIPELGHVKPGGNGVLGVILPVELVDNCVDH